MGTSTGRLWDPFPGRPGDQRTGRSGDSAECFLNSTQKHIKLNLTSFFQQVIEDFIVNCS